MDKNIKGDKIKEYLEEFKWTEKPLLGLEEYVVNRIVFGVIGHVGMAYYFLYLLPFGVVPLATVLVVPVYVTAALLGVAVAAHRFWSHRSFKANKPLKIILMIMQTMGAQYPIFKFCQEHRTHHKFVDTNADPHTSTRGFWFSYLGWLLQPKHPDYIEAAKKVDMSDLAEDEIVRFQNRHFQKLVLLVVAFFMSLYKWMFPNMTLFHIWILHVAQNGLFTHAILLFNSLVHHWGTKPYDKTMTAADNWILSTIAVGDAMHNFHHAFPYDYNASEFGYKNNLSKNFIDFFAWLGWAYDLKSVSPEVFKARINRTGDENHPLYEKNVIEE